MKAEVELTDKQRAQLEAICREDGISQSDVLSGAIDAFLEAREHATHEQERLDREEKMRIRLAALGLWKDHEVKGEEYLAQLRSEWNR